MMRTGQVRFFNDTLREMAKWAAKRYRLGPLRIAYRAQIKGGGGRFHNSGVANVYEKSAPLIELSTGRTYRTLVKVLAHELAHVMTWKRHRKIDHGPEFRANFRELVRSWNRHVEIMG